MTDNWSGFTKKIGAAFNRGAGTAPGMVGTTTTYEDDGNGNEIEVVKDATGKRLSSRATGKKLTTTCPNCGYTIG